MIDWTLIEDETYFVIETVQNTESLLVGCGGWGKRRTLYGGDHTIELGSTIPGEPFYIARGYKELSRDMQIAANGSQNIVIKMLKEL